MTRILLSLALAAYLGAAWPGAETGPLTSGEPKDVAALQQRIAQWTEGYNAADLAKLGDVFSADFSFEQQGMPAQPRDAVLKGYADLFAKYDTRIQVDTREIRASGDMAFDRGSYVSTSTPKAGGKPLVQKGRFLEVWKRVGGVWQTQRFVNISDNTQ
jgi:uncharacterized protein (TIGR02246 family)